MKSSGDVSLKPIIWFVVGFAAGMTFMVLLALAWLVFIVRFT